MITILFLDDSIARHAYIYSRFGQKYRRCTGQIDQYTAIDPDTQQECSVIHTFRVAQAKQILSIKIIDVLLLDNDLVKDGGPKEEGREIVNFISSLKKEHWPKKVIIHTWNEPAAKLMQAGLQELGIPYERIPFTCA